MATTLSYSVAAFVPLTKIVSADMNTILRTDIINRINWAGGTSATTGLGDDNIQSNTAAGGGLTRATKLKLGTASHVIVNDVSGAMSSEATLATARGGLGFVPTVSLANAGKAIVVSDDGSAFSLGSPTQATLTQSFSGDITTLTAGEGISANDAVCLDLHNGSGSNVYRVFKCDSDLANRRRNFLGISTAAATVTAGIYTYTLSAALVASNVVTTTLNSRTYATTYASSSDATLQAIATALATDPDVVSAVVTVVGGNQTGTDDRVITVTSRGGLSLNMSAVVTLGASQATVTVLNTQAASGQNVQIRCFGPITAQSGLTTGSLYYVSDTAGAITASPIDTNPIQVGQALSSTVLFVNSNLASFVFGTADTFIRSHGTSGDGSDANATQDVEHYNGTSWSAGSSSAAGVRGRLGTGNTGFGGFHHQIDGCNTSGTIAALFQKYNKTSWSTLSNQSTARSNYGVAAFNSLLYCFKGTTDNAGTGVLSGLSKWNGSTWASGTSLTGATYALAGFVQNSLLRAVGGNDSGDAATNVHHTQTSAGTNGTDTVLTAAHACGGGSSSGTTGSNGFISHATDGSSGTTSYKWNGTSWSTITASYSSTRNSAKGFSTTMALAFTNAGYDGSNAKNSTDGFNDTTCASRTASTNSRSLGTGSVI